MNQSYHNRKKKARSFLAFSYYFFWKISVSPTLRGVSPSRRTRRPQQSLLALGSFRKGAGPAGTEDYFFRFAFVFRRSRYPVDPRAPLANQLALPCRKSTYQAIAKEGGSRREALAAMGSFLRGVSPLKCVLWVLSHTSKKVPRLLGREPTKAKTRHKLKLSAGAAASAAPYRRASAGRAVGKTSTLRLSAPLPLATPPKVCGCDSFSCAAASAALSPSRLAAPSPLQFRQCVPKSTLAKFTLRLKNKQAYF